MNGSECMDSFTGIVEKWKGGEQFMDSDGQIRSITKYTISGSELLFRSLYIQKIYG